MSSTGVIATALLTAALGLGLVACGGGGGGNASTVTPFVFDTPEGFPEPRLRESIPMSQQSVALGRRLFYDRRMSINQQASCATCHEQRLAFTDGLTTSVGPTGDIHPRNAMSLTNTVYNARQNWANPNMMDLRQQALGVLLNEDTLELGWSGREQEMLDRFRNNPDDVARFSAAFPEDEEPVNLDNVVKAVAAFTATLISGNAARDRFYSLIDPDPDAMSPAARRGEALFFSERLECFHCHGGFNFAQSVVHQDSTLDAIEYRNNGLYNLAGPGGGNPLPEGNYPANNHGLFEFTGQPRDMGRFRAPSLRNIVLTAPYMHDGSIATLREVIQDHYARAGRLIENGPFAGDGSQSPFRDGLLVEFQLSENELQDLLAFFDSLTDWEFICEPRFSDPFGHIPMHENCGTAPLQ